MMPIPARFHRASMKWRCACGATLATVVQAEQLDTSQGFDIQAMLFQTHKKRIVAALELSRGFVFHKGRGVWLKPIHTLPSNRGAQNANERQRRDAFERGRLERAQHKNDPASIVEATYKLRQVEERQYRPSAPTNESLDELKPHRIFADELPIKIQCPNQDCKKVHGFSVI